MTSPETTAPSETHPREGAGRFSAIWPTRIVIALVSTVILTAGMLAVASPASAAGPSSSKDKKRPTVSIAVPGIVATVQNPVTISGAAIDNEGITSVRLLVVSTSNGQFFDGSGWSNTVVTIPTNLASPGAASTAWSTSLMLPPGSSFVVIASATDTSGNVGLSFPRLFSTSNTGRSDLTVQKSSASTFVQGGSASYTLFVTNVGTGATVGPINVTDPMPAGLSVIGTPAGAGWDCAASTLTSASCARAGAIGAGASAPPITFDVNVSPSAPASITNTASVNGGGETNTGNNSGTVTVTVSPAGKPDLTLTKTTSSTFVQGGTAAYVLAVANSGTAATTGTATVNDTMPSGLTILGVPSGSGWDCSTSTATTLTCDHPSPIAVGLAAPIVVNVSIAANAAALITNTASVTGGGETNTSNNSGTVVVAVTQTGPPDLTITNTAIGTGFQQGGTVTYELTINNIGNGPTTGTITMTETMPTGITATSASGTGWTCTIGPVVSCTRTTPIPAGTTSTITLTANISPTAPPTITTTAQITGGGETITNNNVGVSIITVM